MELKLDLKRTPVTQEVDPLIVPYGIETQVDTLVNVVFTAFNCTLWN